MNIGAFLFHQGRKAGGAKYNRRSRHRRSQMKAISRKRFSGRGARFGL